MSDFDEIADELYGLPPEDFTAARTRYEKEAKAAGDRDGAARIHSLAKPTVTAWLANQLAREHRSELEPLLELGAGLREATRNLAGDQLRALSRQQHQLVHALVEQARRLARAAGRNVSEETLRGVDDTLRAALADEQAATLVLAGHLTDALHSSDFDIGFGGVSAGADVIPISRAGSRQNAGGRRGGSPEQRQQGLVDAQHTLAHATAALDDATSALDDAQARAAEADQAATSAADRVEELWQQLEALREQLEEAATAASAADGRRREESSALERAQVAVRLAQRRRDDAQARRDALAGDD